MTTEAKPIKSAEEILAMPDLKEMQIHVPEWDSRVRIKALSKGRHQAIRKECVKDGVFDAERWEWAVLRQGIVEPQFTDAQFEQLREKSAAAIELIGQAIIKLSGLTPERTKEIEKLFT
jgi:hypothetical protein